MPAPSSFLKLRGGANEREVRTQDSIGNTLAPVATRLNNTPIMGAEPPPWVRPDLLNGFAPAIAVAGFNLVLRPQYHVDALGYFHGYVTLYHPTGCAANTVCFRLPAGSRPGNDINFTGTAAAGTGIVFDFLFRSNGNVVTRQAFAAADTLMFVATFLSEN